MQFNRKYVECKNGNGKWDKLRKNHPPLIIDGLSNNTYSKWTVKRDFYLGAHMLNDLIFRNTGDQLAYNFVVRPLLKVVTIETTRKDSELFIN